jgi:hypothetical protein
VEIGESSPIQGAEDFLRESKLFKGIKNAQGYQVKTMHWSKTVNRDQGSDENLSVIQQAWTTV